MPAPVNVGAGQRRRRSTSAPVRPGVGGEALEELAQPLLDGGVVEQPVPPGQADLGRAEHGDAEVAADAAGIDRLYSGVTNSLAR
jgi:hypothetical protein